MFCPKCRYEYRPEITKCPDCDTWLVTTLPEEPDADTEPEPDEELLSQSLQIVCTIDDFHVLQLAKAILENAGIGYHVKNEGSASGRQSTFGNLRSYQILVLPDDFMRATDILETMNEAGTIETPDNIPIDETPDESREK